MYADRYGPRKVNRGSLSISVGIVGGLLAVTMMSSPYVTTHVFPKPPLTFVPVPPDEPPRPPEPKPQPKIEPRQTAPRERIDQPPVVVPVERPSDPYVAPPVPGPTIDLGTLDGAGTGAVVVDPPKPPTPPVLTKADVDPRYAGEFQPPYPPAEQRAGNEGVVVLKVLIGVDGRVREVERVAAASEDFWRVTQQRALSKWRFKPATRDGVPIESWRTMTVRFKLEAD